jgi:hypothetical protein
MGRYIDVVVAIGQDRGSIVVNEIVYKAGRIIMGDGGHVIQMNGGWPGETC